MKKLGILEKVNLRDVWKREDTDFTKWLAKDENISILLDEIGISAENIGDLKGACDDWRKAASLGDEDAFQWVKDQCD